VRAFNSNVFNVIGVCCYRARFRDRGRCRWRLLVAFSYAALTGVAIALTFRGHGLTAGLVRSSSPATASSWSRSRQDNCLRTVFSARRMRGNEHVPGSDVSYVWTLVRTRKVREVRGGCSTDRGSAARGCHYGSGFPIVESLRRTRGVLDRREPPALGSTSH